MEYVPLRYDVVDRKLIVNGSETAQVRGIFERFVEHGFAAVLARQSPRKRANNTRAQTPALLKGMIFSETGAAMTLTTTKKGLRLYRYYVCMDVIRNRDTGDETASTRLAAGMAEEAVVTEIRRILQTP